MRTLGYSRAVEKGLVQAPHTGVLTEEQRPKRRKTVLLPAVIACEGGKHKCDCTIRDLTEAGARVAFPANTEFPARIFLINIPDRIVYDAQTIWCGKSEVGLAFVKTRPLKEISDPALGFLRRLWMERAIR
jgi:hypothetical protein